jgi:glycosyltransferase involved in cell wall biosynthesis
MNKILIVTDAWRPQVSGVITTLEQYCKHIPKKNTLFTLNYKFFKMSFPCPLYNEIRLAIPSFKVIKDSIKHVDHIHILTEGPIGICTAIMCKIMGYKYTTSLLTRFDQYIGIEMPFLEKFINYCMKVFHSGAEKTFISTQPLKEELESKGFKNLCIIEKGIDTDLFNIRPKNPLRKYPTLLYVGRVSKEKNLEEFLSLNIEGQKVIVGDGPCFDLYKSKYPGVIFTGTLHGEKLAEEYSSADVFVFPSKSETFGLVLTEAIASGTPVAALHSPSSDVIITNGINGYVDNDLTVAIKKCLTIDRNLCRLSILKYSWEKSSDIFVNNLVDK